ncbi:lumenal Hsp70 protein [Malassezia cuniculi]|uniref:Lumenal Hsp70 protein n=1 Tax=Malassezia cuniculi TaxID=948313 RepID=A0AAF0EUK0_9BASI|nr:lumenal Hsp70 protein [Malassezia cuniculi]
MVGTGVSFALAFVLALALFVAQCAAFGVVSIDYGTEWTKTALMKPGLPFDVVLGRDSKRKIQSTLAFKGKYPTTGDVAVMERLLGGDAYNFASRDPNLTFHAAKLLLGRGCENETPDSVELYKRVFGNTVIPPYLTNHTGSTCLVLPKKEVPNPLRPEVLVGMQFDHVRELVEEIADEKLSIGFSLEHEYLSAQKGLDSVVTVPVFYTASERQAIFNAAVFAGFRPHLVSDSAAIAATYAQTRTFDHPETHIFYDSGSGATRAALVELRTERVAAESIASIKTPRDVNVVRVLEATWERNVGGLELDLRVRDYLARAFDKEHKSALGGASVFQNERAMARLLREANRVKHVLSANAVAFANIESVMNDLDLHTSLERSAFEDLLREDGLVERFAAPITELLKRTGRSIDSIDSVVLAGGNTRVPVVQQALRDAGIPENKLAQNINADEAAVMGAALFGATFQPQLRMKPLRVEDFQPYTIEFRDPNGVVHKAFPAGPMTGYDAVYQISGITDDATFTLDYAEESHDRLPDDDNGRMYRVVMSNIASELEPVRTAGEISKVNTEMNITLNTFPQGTVRVLPVPFSIKPQVSVVDSLRSFFGLDSNATVDAKTEKLVDVDLDIQPTSLVRPIAGDDRIGSAELLRRVTYEARQRVLREEIYNQLEGGIYEARALPENEDFIRASKQYERESLVTIVKELGDWLAAEGESASAEALNKKQKELAAYVDPILARVEEAKVRDASVASLKAAISDSSAFVTAARANLTAALEAQLASKYSATELDSLAMQIDKDSKWLEEGLTKQAKKAVHDDPAILSKDIDRRSKKLRDTVKRLEKRRLPKTRPPKKSNSSSKDSKKNASSSSTSSSSSDATSSTSTSTSTFTSTSGGTSTPEPVHDEL